MKSRLSLTVGLLCCAAVLCGVLLRGRQPRPWYFDEPQCEARLLGKTAQEVEEAVGSRPDYFGRPRQKHPEYDESSWGLGICARAAWQFTWGTITVEYDEQERSVAAVVWQYHPAWGETSRIAVSR
jgi:hypothetical protein